MRFSVQKLIIEILLTSTSKTQAGNPRQNTVRLIGPKTLVNVENGTQKASESPPPKA